MPDTVVLKPSWTWFVRTAVRRYRPPVLISAVLVVAGSIAVLRVAGAPPWTPLLWLLAGLLLLDQDVSQLSRWIEVRDSEVRINGRGGRQTVPRSELAGLALRDVVGLAGTRRYAVLYDRASRRRLLLNRAHWDDPTLQELGRILGMPVSSDAETRSVSALDREFKAPEAAGGFSSRPPP